MKQQLYNRQSKQKFSILGQQSQVQNANSAQRSQQIFLNHIITDFHNSDCYPHKSIQFCKGLHLKGLIFFNCHLKEHTSLSRKSLVRILRV